MGTLGKESTPSKGREPPATVERLPISAKEKGGSSKKKTKAPTEAPSENDSEDLLDEEELEEE